MFPAYTQTAFRNDSGETALFGSSDYWDACPGRDRSGSLDLDLGTNNDATFVIIGFFKFDYRGVAVNLALRSTVFRLGSDSIAGNYALSTPPKRITLSPRGSRLVGFEGGWLSKLPTLYTCESCSPHTDNVI